MRSKPPRGGWTAGGAPAGGVEGGVLVESSAHKAGLNASKLPTANTVINIVLFAFIIFSRGLFFNSAAP
jgi:hypothetical protein